MALQANSSLEANEIGGGLPDRLDNGASISKGELHSFRNGTPGQEILVSRFFSHIQCSENKLKTSCRIHSGDSHSLRVSYVELWDMAQRCRARFRGLGFKHGDVVALAIPSSEWLLTVLLAAWAERLVVCMLPHNVSSRSGHAAPEKFAEMINLISPHFLIADENTLSHVPTNMTAPKERYADFIAVTRDCQPLSDPPLAVLEDTAIFQFTSGSSGIPKAVVILKPCWQRTVQPLFPVLALTMATVW